MTIYSLDVLLFLFGKGHSRLLFSYQVMSDSLRAHGLQHTRLPYLSPAPRVCPSLCPLNQWCNPTISSSFTLFFCLQSFPASVSFPVSQLFSSGGQSIGASASVLPMNIQDWFPLGLTNVWSPCCPRDSQESSPAPQFTSINSSVLSLLYGPVLTSIHDYWKKHNFFYMDLCLQSNVSAF